MINGWCSMLAAAVVAAAPPAEWYVAPGGDDAQAGTAKQPFATLARAQRAARDSGAARRVVHLAGGTHYLAQPLVLGAEDSGTLWQGDEGAPVVLSGGRRLDALAWKPYRDGILQADVPADVDTDQLFINGERQILARYPNYDANQRIFNGYAADAFDAKRAARWADPRGGYMHAMHEAMWGGFSYVITGKDAKGSLTYEGGWQNNRPARMHRDYRFVEGIFEELDAPGEWFLSRAKHLLYYYPPAGLDLSAATVETVRLKQLVEFRGTAAAPVRHVTLRGVTLRHTRRTFMETREPLLRSDWAIFRGGAVFMEGAEDCTLEDCFLDQVGGNAVFINNYNRRVTVRGCHIAGAGANGIALVGDPVAARSASSWHDQRQLKDIDLEAGPKSDNYPADCLVEDCLIHGTGRVEKQTAPVEMDLARRITVRHCSLYDVPRAGINIGDGCWGGHVIEDCDVFDTVLETGDHGSFNSWGRDRFWGLGGVDLNTVLLGEHAALPFLDAVEPTLLRHNRWRCDHGWDIDLDDGSSNYQIRDNLCLNGGLKNREGFRRVVENNILVNNGFHPHVWFADSDDVVRCNLMVSEGYLPAGGMPSTPWGREMDFNLVHRAGIATPRPASKLASQSKRDAHSLIADARLVDPAAGDYRVKEGSPALALGFVNFAMDDFGVTSPKLRALARTPAIPALVMPGGDTAVDVTSLLLGAEARDIHGLGDRSAYGLPDESGVLLLKTFAGGDAERAGLRADDVITGCDGRPVGAMVHLRPRTATGRPLSLEVRRKQQMVTVKASDYVYVETETAPDAAAFQHITLRAGSLTGTLSSTPDTHNEPLSTLLDGKLTRNYGPVFGNGVTNGVYRLDLGSARAIAAIDTFSFNQEGRRGAQHFVLLAGPTFEALTPLAEVDTRGQAAATFVASRIQRAGGQPLGAFRCLAWAVRPVSEVGGGENTAFQEFQVVAAP